MESVDQLEAEGRSEILIETMARHSLLQKYIQSPLMMITNEIEKGIQEYYLQIRLVFFLTNLIVIAVCLFFWRIGWKKYVSGLN